LHHILHASTALRRAANAALSLWSTLSCCHRLHILRANRHLRHLRTCDLHARQLQASHRHASDRHSIQLNERLHITASTDNHSLLLLMMMLLSGTREKLR